jgi:hypothetical protein
MHNSLVKTDTVIRPKADLVYSDKSETYVVVSYVHGALSRRMRRRSHERCYQTQKAHRPCGVLADAGDACLLEFRGTM